VLGNDLVLVKGGAAPARLLHSPVGFRVSPDSPLLYTADRNNPRRFPSDETDAATEEGMSEKNASTEFDIAGEILEPIVRESGVEVIVSGREEIRFRIHKHFGWRLASVIFRRDALRNLISDPLRAIKVGYLQRELEQSVKSRREFRYPRPSGPMSLSNRIDSVA
jgi:hypothetical protein